MNWSNHFASRAQHMRASEIRELLKLLDQGDIISFAGGIPDARLFPIDDILEASTNILSDPSRSTMALQYSVSEGYAPLRKWLATNMGQRGVACSQDNILITNGSQQALDFLGKLFISSGDLILTSSPTYLGALQAFNAYEPVYGLLPQKREESKALCARAPKFGYVMPDFQNPTGTSLTLNDREKLLDLAAEIDMPLIEDNAYECLRYDGEALPSLLALDILRKGSIEKSQVIYCGTFSKSIVPALRVGWIVAPKPVIEKLVLINQASGLHVSSFNQMIMHEVAAKIIDAHTSKVREVYKKRRDAMLRALAREMPDDVSWTSPSGGMFIWLTLPATIDTAVLLQEAIEKARVAFVPGAAFYPDRSGGHTLRLSFSLAEPDQIDEGIRRLAGLIAAKTASHEMPEAVQFINKM